MYYHVFHYPQLLFLTSYYSPQKFRFHVVLFYCLCVWPVSKFPLKKPKQGKEYLFYLFWSTVIGLNQGLNYNCYTLSPLNIVLRIRAVLSPDIGSFSPKDRTFTVENVTQESWNSHISCTGISSTHFPSNPIK